MCSLIFLITFSFFLVTPGSCFDVIWPTASDVYFHAKRATEAVQELLCIQNQCFGLSGVLLLLCRDQCLIQENKYFDLDKFSGKRQVDAFKSCLQARCAGMGQDAYAECVFQRCLSSDSFGRVQLAGKRASRSPTTMSSTMSKTVSTSSPLDHKRPKEKLIYGANGKRSWNDLQQACIEHFKCASKKPGSYEYTSCIVHNCGYKRSVRR